MQDSTLYEKLEKLAKEKGLEIFKISAATGEGLKELMHEVANVLKTLPKEQIVEATAPKKVYRLEEEEPYTITRKDDMFVVDGPAIRELMRKVNMEDNESLYYFQKRLSELGVNQKLKDAGVQEGDTVKVFDYLLEWED